MKLLNSVGPNPRMVRMFLLEKKLEIPFEEIDLLSAENRGEAYTRKNPAGQIPALELDDGTVIGETISICEYLDEIHPEPSLVGSTPLERAQTSMWVRRIELDVTEYMLAGFRYAEGLELFKDRMRCLPEAAEGLKAKGRDSLVWLDGLLQGKTYLAGERLSIADLQLYCRLDFTASVGQPMDPALKNLGAWFKRMNERPSATASLSPNWQQAGMRF